jgi:hypothetical protein
MGDPGSRHHLFHRALERSGWDVRQLWLAAVALGGKVGLLDLEAFLYGLTLLPPDQQDVVAVALNERLADLYRSAMISYLTTPALADPPAEHPLTILDEHLRTVRGAVPPSP